MDAVESIRLKEFRQLKKRDSGIKGTSNCWY
jgi:hypothetical protein